MNRFRSTTYTVVEGGSPSFHCQFNTSNSLARAAFYFRSTTTRMSSAGRISVTSKKSTLSSGKYLYRTTLSFRGVRAEDSGIYTCASQSYAGVSIYDRRCFGLNVRGKEIST